MKQVKYIACTNYIAEKEPLQISIYRGYLQDIVYIFRNMLTFCHGNIDPKIDEKPKTTKGLIFALNKCAHVLCEPQYYEEISKQTYTNAINDKSCTIIDCKKT